MAVAPRGDGEGGDAEAPGARPRRHRRSLIIVVAIAAVAAVICGAIASRRLMSRPAQYAQVISVRRMSRPVRMPREVCKSEEVRHSRPELARPESGGKHTGHHARVDDSYTTTEEHCATILEVEDEPQGYQVRYRLDGVEGTLHMDHAPGARILLRDGQLVPASSSAPALRKR